MDTNAITWLLDGDPAIRWQTLRDLTDAPPEDIDHERTRLTTEGLGAALLSRQEADGTWGGGLYSPKWTSTTYTLLLLRQFGLDPSELRARRGVERIWDGARYLDGGLTPAVTIDAPEACATSMYLALALYLGVEHQRVEPALNWLLANQLADGGWNCRTVRFGDHFAATDSPHDDPYIDALDLIARKRRDDGTWPLQNKHPGRVWFDMEESGKPSRWNTLRALRVMRWHGRITSGDSGATILPTVADPAVTGESDG